MTSTAHEDQYTSSPEEEAELARIQANIDSEKPHEADARRLDTLFEADMHSVSNTLDQRGKNYGEFSEGAAIMQSLKDVARDTNGWQRLNNPQREAIDMIFSKLGRILNGDPNHADSWHDIAGYAQLVERELLK